MTGTAGQLLRAIPIVIALVILGLAGIAALFGLSIPPWQVWSGAAGGAALGLGMGVLGALGHANRARKTSTDHLAAVEIPRPAATGT
jgi:hypothetical protein